MDIPTRSLANDTEIPVVGFGCAFAHGPSAETSHE